MKLEHYRISKQLAALYLRALNDIIMIGTAFDDGRSCWCLVKGLCVGYVLCINFEDTTSRFFLLIK